MNRIRNVVLFLAALQISSCGAGWSITAPDTIKEACIVARAGEHVEPAAAIHVPLNSPFVTGRLPSDPNSAAMLMLRQFYQPLFWRDCTGDIRPGVAQSWSQSADDMEWTIKLRSGLSYWDGSPVRAPDLLTHFSTIVGHSSTISAVETPNDETLLFKLREPDARFPEHLTNPIFSVQKEASGVNWPLGTGRFEITSLRSQRVAGARAPDSGRGSTVQIRRTVNASSTSRAGTHREFVFESIPDADARDFIARGANVIYTFDPDVVSLGTNTDGYIDTELPHQFMYGLVLSSAARGVTQDRGVIRFISPANAPDLADYVDADADVSRWGDRSQQSLECKTERGIGSDLTQLRPSPIQVGRDRTTIESDRSVIYFEAGDPIAKSISERILSLLQREQGASIIAGFREHAPLSVVDWASARVQGVSPAELRLILNGSTNHLAILPFPIAHQDYCAPLPVLGPSGEFLIDSSSSSVFWTLPLVDVRPHLLHKGDLSTISIDWNGYLRMEP